jgi:hypothetical protein
MKLWYGEMSGKGSLIHQGIYTNHVMETRSGLEGDNENNGGGCIMTSGGR